MFARNLSIALAVCSLFSVAGCTGPSAPAGASRLRGISHWQAVPLRGVSGLAWAGNNQQAHWLAVSDAKNPGEPRAILLARSENGDVQVRGVRWVGEEPVDLEALSAVPGTTDRFVAVTSKGEWFAVQLTRGAARVTQSGTLPNRAAIKELEGFSLAPIGNDVLAVWGNRGSTNEPGRLFWCTWGGSEKPSFGAVQYSDLQLPWPSKHIRHISDLRLNSNGRLVVSSASDPGDEGPFASAVWEVGRFEAAGGLFNWKPLGAPIQLLHDGPNGHKIEAIAADSNGHLVVASDDEALGSAIRFYGN